MADGKKAAWSTEEVEKLDEFKEAEGTLSAAIRRYNQFCQEHHWPERSVEACRRKMSGKRKYTVKGTASEVWTDKEDDVLEELKARGVSSNVYNEFINSMRQRMRNDQYTMSRTTVMNKWGNKRAKKGKRWNNTAHAILRTIMEKTATINEGVNMAINMFQGDGFVVSRRIILQKWRKIKNEWADAQLYRLAGVPENAKLTEDVVEKLSQVLNDLIAGDEEFEEQLTAQEKAEKDKESQIVTIDIGEDEGKDQEKKEEKESSGKNEGIEVEDSEFVFRNDDEEQKDDDSAGTNMLKMKNTTAEDIFFIFSCQDKNDRQHYVSRLPKYSDCVSGCVNCCHARYIRYREVYFADFKEEAEYKSLLILGNHLDATTMMTRMNREMSHRRQEWNVKEVSNFIVSTASVLSELLKLDELDADLAGFLRKKYGYVLKKVTDAEDIEIEKDEDRLHYQLGYVRLRMMSTSTSVNNKEYLSLVICMEEIILILLDEPIIPFRVSDSIEWLPKESILQHVRRCQAVNVIQHLDRTIYRALMTQTITFESIGFNLNDHPNIQGRLSSLDQYQRQAVVDCLSYKGFLIIQGPYGCGKSTTIAALVFSLFQVSKGKILVTSEANAAIDAIASKLAEDVELRRKVLRLGKPRVKNDNVDKYCALLALIEQEKEKLKRHNKDISTAELTSKLKNYKKKLIATRQIILCTLSHAFSGGVRKCQFDNSIVDEASQVTANGLIMGLRNNTQRIISVGDVNQQPPYSSLPNDLRIRFFPGGREHHLCQSAMELFLKNGEAHSLVMNNQYRTHPMISRYLKRFYRYPVYDMAVPASDYLASLRITVGATMLGDRRMVFVNVISNMDRFSRDVERDDRDYVNHSEVQFIQFLLKDISYLIAPDEQKRILIITPYSRQKRLLMNMLHTLKTRELSRRLFVEVMTIDGAQGEEGDIVILSMVRRNRHGKIGFLADNSTRALVAFSRAKDYLFVIWNEDTFSGQNIYGDILNDAKADRDAMMCIEDIGYHNLKIPTWH